MRRLTILASLSLVVGQLGCSEPQMASATGTTSSDRRVAVSESAPKNEHPLTGLPEVERDAPATDAAERGSPPPVSAAKPKEPKRRASVKGKKARARQAKRADGVETMGIGSVGVVGRGSGTASYGSSRGSLRAGGGGSRARVRGATGGVMSNSLSSVDSAPQARGGAARSSARRRSVASVRAPSRGPGSSPRLAPPPPPRPDPTYDLQDKGGTFAHAGTNPFTDTSKDRHSTFAVDVDTASYTYARRFLASGNRPSTSSVRLEEWVNAFHYSYEAPGRGAKHPFNIVMQAGPSPLEKTRHILRVGIKGKEISNRDRKPVHLTFLVDVSGSMGRHDKLPLAQKSLHLLVDQLRSDDSVALITYAGRTSQVLPQTSAKEKATIHRAIDGLNSGGGTAMGSGMEMAYQNANKVLSSGSVSRVIVLSDGDANIGRTGHKEILQTVKGYVSEGIKLSTVGFGTGNYRDHLMEQLADAGDGNYSYIDSMKAARKVFVQDLTGTLQVIAKDVKIQVEFDPKVVKSYRLLGYENRDVADKDFRNDKVDAGEIGAGHAVTALYEVELVDPRATVTDDLATVRVRYKQPKGSKAREVARRFTSRHMQTRFGDLDSDTRWAVAVSVAAEVLRGSPYAADKTLQDAWALASEAMDGPWAQERRELVNLLDTTVRREQVAAR